MSTGPLDDDRVGTVLGADAAAETAYVAFALGTEPATGPEPPGL